MSSKSIREGQIIGMGWATNMDGVNVTTVASIDVSMPIGKTTTEFCAGNVV